MVLSPRERLGKQNQASGAQALRLNVLLFRGIAAQSGGIKAEEAV